MDNECTDRRISDIEILAHEFGALEKKGNTRKGYRIEIFKKECNEKISRYYVQ
jgi:hypothetical protein